MELKEKREYEINRGRSKEKNKNDNKAKFRKPSPPPPKLGNIKKAKGFCSHCAPIHLLQRIESKQDALVQIKDEVQCELSE